MTSLFENQMTWKKNDITPFNKFVLQVPIVENLVWRLIWHDDITIASSCNFQKII